MWGISAQYIFIGIFTFLGVFYKLPLREHFLNELTKSHEKTKLSHHFSSKWEQVLKSTSIHPFSAA